MLSVTNRERAAKRAYLSSICPQTWQASGSLSNQWKDAHSVCLCDPFRRYRFFAVAHSREQAASSDTCSSFQTPSLFDLKCPRNLVVKSHASGNGGGRKEKCCAHLGRNKEYFSCGANNED